MDMVEFCKIHLKTDVKAFQYRRRNKRCYPNEVILISWILKESVKDLFGEDFNSLMAEHGDEEITRKIRDMFSGASDKEKKKYMVLLGISAPRTLPAAKSEVKSEAEPEPEVKVIQSEKPKEKPKGSQKFTDFFDDLVIRR